MPTITWDKTIPDNYNPATQRVQWMDLVPEMVMDTSHGIFLAGRDEDTLEYLFNKGVTHVSRGSFDGYTNQQAQAYINAGRSAAEPPTQTHVQLAGARLNGQPIVYDRGSGIFVPTDKHYPDTWNTRFFGPLRPGQTQPLTYEQGFEAGSTFTIDHCFVAFENEEQDHAVDAHWELWRGFYDAYIPRMEARWGQYGVRWYVMHNYFRGIGGDENPGSSLMFSSADQARAFMSTPSNQWKGVMVNGGTLSKTNTVAFACYLPRPGMYSNWTYEQIWKAEIAHRANKYQVSYAQAVHEDNPNNVIKIKVDGGDFYLDTKLPAEPHLMSTFAIQSWIFGDGFSTFNGQGKQSKPFKFLRSYHRDNSLWRPTGSTEPANIDSAPVFINEGEGQEIFPAAGQENHVGFARKDYYNTFRNTRGGQRKFLDFRINGGNWITAQNNGNLEDIVRAMKVYNGQQKRIVFAETLGNRTSIYTINPYGAPEEVQLEFKHPVTGVVYDSVVSSTNYSVASIIL
jgi:hypothetical protein